MVRRFGSLLELERPTPTTQSGRGRFEFQRPMTCNTFAAKALKELSRPLARERDITSRSEPRCRRQLYKAGGAFSLSRRLLLASAASNPTTALSARIFSAGVIPAASLCAPRPFHSRFGLRFDSRSNPSEIARALPGPAPPLSRFSRHGEGEDYTRAFGVGVVTRVVLCVYTQSTAAKRRLGSFGA